MAAADVPPFVFFQEFYGKNGYTDPVAAQFLKSQTISGLTFSPPVVSGIVQLAGPYGAALMLRLAGAAAPSGMSDSAIDSQRADLETQAFNNPQLDFIWDLMPEWDQSGGGWVSNGRPQYTNLSKADAHTVFVTFYQSSYPALMKFLRQPTNSRHYRTAAVTDYSPNTFYAYEMGVDLCMLERGIDELSDLSTGIAFLRGAARQYDRLWGIELSSWRTSNDMATQYTNRNVLLGGWSASYLSRHYYASFVSGANVIQNEAASYRNADGHPNPLSDATQAFADFALRRHPSMGSPVVTTALLIDHNSGFDPKHGLYNQANAVWYQDIPYSSGDFMIDNVFRLAYPNHWLHGLTPGAPFANSTGAPDPAGFNAFLANGGDPRPYEPMPTTRWGDNLDVITTAAQAAALTSYKVIVLTGDVHLDSRLRNDLLAWVNLGGVLLINFEQTTPADQDMIGVTLASSSQRTGRSSRWLSNAATQSESSYRYSVVNAGSAEVLAVSETSDPLITRRKLGAGEVWLTTPSYMQSAAKDRILQVCTQLLDSQIARYSAASLAGAPVEYIVNQDPTRIIVTVINNSGSDWAGQITASRTDAVAAVAEYVTDQSLEFAQTSAGPSIQAQVPAYGVRVFAFDYASPIASSRPTSRAIRQISSSKQ